MLLRGNLSRGRGLLLGGLHIAATAATAAAAAAVSTTAATTAIAAVATAVATIAMMASTVACMATTVAAAASAAAAAENEGRSLVLTAHQGDSDQREKHRETKNNNTVHPRILQLLTGTVSGKYQVAVQRGPLATADGSASQSDPALLSHH